MCRSKGIEPKLVDNKFSTIGELSAKQISDIWGKES